MFKGEAYRLYWLGNYRNENYSRPNRGNTVELLRIKEDSLMSNATSTRECAAVCLNVEYAEDRVG
ncbi:MAG: hypothetical protein LBK06_11040 [Planctomycetaceae bacterium]|nr:hypothetical protein [Planctomycetaceae bacterium]